jgi:hypothetical protein
VPYHYQGLLIVKVQPNFGMDTNSLFSGSSHHSISGLDFLDVFRSVKIRNSGDSSNTEICAAFQPFTATPREVNCQKVSHKVATHCSSNSRGLSQCVHQACANSLSQLPCSLCNSFEPLSDMSYETVI